MTKIETGQLMDLLETAYPRYYAGKDNAERDRALTLWHEMLRDYPLDLVKVATKAVIAVQKFPPSVSEVLDKIRMLTTPPEMGEAEAWALVLSAVRNAGYHAEEEFRRLPMEVQSAIGSAGTLHTWAMQDVEELSTVTQSNFMRSFRGRAASRREVDALPSDIRAMLSQTAARLEISER